MEQRGIRGMICITRPRRFGKTVAANMISAFFSNACDAREVFDLLQIAKTADYDKCLNQFPVIHISFNELGSRCSSYRDYIERIEKRLLRDLKKEYLMFLRNLLKDRPYVRLAYMTGILPIAKYSSGSELNMFSEFTMASEERFSEYFGFTDQEVDDLFARYKKKRTETAQITREDLKKWYDGYHTKGGERLYNPRSVVMSLSNNNLGNYWTSSGPYDEIFYYIRNNVDAVKDDLALMVSGQAIPAKIWEYAATSQELKTKEQILSAMVVYGFLSYEGGNVFIPNKELLDQFSDMLKREESLGDVYCLAKASKEMLEATLRGDVKIMEQILEQTHDIETPILSYNHETELSAVVNLTYLSARDYYRVEREEKAGKGFVDFIFYPEMPSIKTGIILELKVDHSPEEALAQIREKTI